MYWYECKKILFQQKGICFILLFLAIKLISLCLFTEPDNEKLVTYHDSYQKWLAEAGGELDEEKIALLEQTSEEYTERSGGLKELYADYAEGNITDAELAEGIAEWEVFLAEQGGFDALFSQFLYAVSDPGQRYLLDTNAWAGLLAKDDLNYPLILVVALLSLITFGAEQKSGMDHMLRTGIRGQKCVLRNKLLNLFLITAGLVSADFLLEIGYFQIRYGFAHGNYPLQSLSYFSDCPREVTLGMAAFLLFVLRIAGYVYLMLLSCFFIRFTKRYSVSVILLLVMILIPYYGIKPNYLCYYLPLPVGWLMGSGYFLGTQYDSADYMGQILLKYSFRQMEKPEFLLLAGGILVICLAILWYLGRSYSNLWVGKRKRLTSLAAALCFCFLFSGCSGDTDSENDSLRIYNPENLISDEGDDYIFYEEMTEDTITLCFRNKQTGESGEVVSDVFSDAKMYYYWPIFVDDSHIYYMMMSNSYDVTYFEGENYDTFWIKCLDMETFETSTYFSYNGVSEPSVALGLGTYHDAVAEFFWLIEDFWISGDTIYLKNSEGIWKMDRRSGLRTQLIELTEVGNVCYDGERFYYRDSCCRLHIYDISSGRDTICEQIITDSNFLLVEGGMIYPNLLDEGKLYYVDWQTQEMRKLLEEIPTYYDTDGTRLFYYEQGTMDLYELDITDSHAVPMFLQKESENSIVNCFRSYDMLFLTSYETYEIREIKK